MDMLGVVTFVHVLSASVLAMTLVIMQTVVGPAMANVPDGDGKKAAVALIQRRWHPVVDAAIILLTVTGPFLLYAKWDTVASNHILHVKILFAAIALVCANLLHFRYRSEKRRLAASGEKERLTALNRLAGRLEKTALYFGAGAFILVAFNHFPL